jgi:hypothetical protein
MLFHTAANCKEATAAVPYRPAGKGSSERYVPVVDASV